MRSALVALALLAPSALAAAELPAPFHGTWRIANASDSSCRKDAVKGAAEGHMIVSAREIEYYESGCRVVAARRLPPEGTTHINVDVRLACEGEGIRWSARELWHTETIDGKIVMAVTQLGQTNTRDTKGRRQKVPSFPGTSIYSLCK